MSVVLRSEVEAGLVCLFGAVEVTKLWHLKIGVAEAVLYGRFLCREIDVAKQLDGFLVVLEAVRVTLVSQDVGEDLNADRRGCGCGCGPCRRVGRRGGEGGGGPVPVPGDELVLEAGGGGQSRRAWAIWTR